MLYIDDFQPFDCRGHTVRAAFLADDVWFVAKDVCALLGFKNPRKAVARLKRKEWRRVEYFDEAALDDRKTTIVSLSGCLDLILENRRPIELFDWFYEFSR